MYIILNGKGADVCSNAVSYTHLDVYKRQLPPYVIFGDSTLREMASKYPINREQMLEITGVGGTKYEKYGNEFESLIKEYVIDNNIKLENENDKIDEKTKKYDNDVLEVQTDVDLYENLRSIRNDLAERANTLPQAILSMSTLKEISGRYPNCLLYTSIYKKRIIRFEK